MGILNVTPDSFSDGGRFFSADKAVERARQMVEEGADIIDVGGESTRPGAGPVSAAEEMRRVIPVIERICGIEDFRDRSGAFPRPSIPVSVDTRHASVAKAAVKAGASIVNCIEKLSVTMAKVVRESGAAVICRCRSREDWDRAVGMVGDSERVLFDPMVGFGTSRAEDLELMARIPDFAKFAPVVAAVSRKRIIGAIAGGGTPQDRLGGSVGAAVWCALNGASVIRAHDVRETAQAIQLVNYMDFVVRGKGTVLA